MEYNNSDVCLRAVCSATDSVQTSHSGLVTLTGTSLTVWLANKEAVYTYINITFDRNTQFTFFLSLNILFIMSTSLHREVCTMTYTKCISLMPGSNSTRATCTHNVGYYHVDLNLWPVTSDDFLPLSATPICLTITHASTCTYTSCHSSTFLHVCEVFIQVDSGGIILG